MAESVSLEVQGRPEVTDVLPIALARELRGRRGLEVPPSSRAVASFLEEARGRREELAGGRREELAGGQGGEELEEREEDRTQLEEAFGRMSGEMETFTVKYQVQCSQFAGCHWMSPGCSNSAITGRAAPLAATEP